MKEGVAIIEIEEIMGVLEQHKFKHILLKNWEIHNLTKKDKGNVVQTEIKEAISMKIKLLKAFKGKHKIPPDTNNNNHTTHNKEVKEADGINRNKSNFL